jgi:AraC-like DNA-binding protein
MAPLPIIALANHANFEVFREPYFDKVESRMCLWSYSGQGRVCINGTTFELNPNDFLYCPWGMNIRYLSTVDDPLYLGGIHLIPRYDISQGIDYHVSHTVDSPLFGSPLRKDEDLLEGGDEIECFRVYPNSPLRLLCEYIISHYNSQQRDDEQLKYLALVLIAELRTTKKEYLTNRKIPREFKILLDHIEQNVTRDISAREMSEIMDCSSGNIRRLFRTYLNLSPVEYINRERVQRAKNMLSTGRLSISKVAENSGFDDQFYFSRIFKKFCGVSPLKYRNETSLM